MLNEKVVMAWVNGQSANNGRGSLSTDGERLLSYDLVIGSRSGRVVFDYTKSGEYYSQTTSKHVGLALHVSGFDIGECPEQAELRLWRSSPRPSGVKQGGIAPKKR